MKTKQQQLERLVSDLKIRWNDLEPVIENNTVKIDASHLQRSEINQLQKYCEHRKFEMQKSVTFKITL